MAYAVVVTGGKQYRVTPGQSLKIEKLGVETGSEYIFDKVLLKVDGDDVQIGRPFLSGIGVKAKVIENARDDKIVVFKYKRKTGYRRKTGHRQSYSLVKIEEIVSGLTVAAAPAATVETPVKKTRTAKTTKVKKAAKTKE